MLALELIDSSLILAQQQGDSVALVREEPGMAVLEETNTWTGTEAAQRVRVKPLLAHSHYWRNLSVDPLTRPSRSIRTAADLAFAHATALLQPFQADREGVLLAVPAGYSRE